MSAPELRAVKRARAKRERVEGELRAAILAARAAGAPLQAIADAAGLTRARIWQIERGK